MQETKEELCRKETEKHIRNVQKLMSIAIAELEDRAKKHDKTKLESPEFEAFVEFTPELKNLVYGSEEYNKILAKIWPTLKHHYENNPHHPDHFEYGINGMTLVDLIEMLADWKSSCLRFKEGDMTKSMRLNTSRFLLSPQLVQIMINTLKLFEAVEPELEKGE